MSIDRIVRSQRHCEGGNLSCDESHNFRGVFFFKAITDHTDWQIFTFIRSDSRKYCSQIVDTSCENSHRLDCLKGRVSLRIFSDCAKVVHSIVRCHCFPSQRPCGRSSVYSITTRNLFQQLQLMMNMRAVGVVIKNISLTSDRHRVDRDQGMWLHSCRIHSCIFHAELQSWIWYFNLLGQILGLSISSRNAYSGQDVVV